MEGMQVVEVILLLRHVGSPRREIMTLFSEVYISAEEIEVEVFMEICSSTHVRVVVDDSLVSLHWPFAIVELLKVLFSRLFIGLSILKWCSELPRGFYLLCPGRILVQHDCFRCIFVFFHFNIISNGRAPQMYPTGDQVSSNQARWSSNMISIALSVTCLTCEELAQRSPPLREKARNWMLQISSLSRFQFGNSLLISQASYSNRVPHATST